MKKNGKKYRKMMKLKEQKRAAQEKKQNPPFSRVSKRKMQCLHYSVIGGGFIVGYGRTYLRKYSETECICGVCRKTFPIEALEKSKELVKYLAGHGCIYMPLDSKYIKETTSLFPPVEYYRVSENDVVYVE